MNRIGPCTIFEINPALLDPAVYGAPSWVGFHQEAMIQAEYMLQYLRESGMGRPTRLSVLFFQWEKMNGELWLHYDPADPMPTTGRVVLRYGLPYPYPRGYLYFDYDEFCFCTLGPECEVAPADQEGLPLAALTGGKK